MVIGDMPLLLEPEAPGWPPGPFRMPVRTSSKPISVTPFVDQQERISAPMVAMPSQAVIRRWT